MIAVIDTNVPVVANGRADQASPACVLTCVDRLRALMDVGTLVLDADYRILTEYHHHLRSSGQPGVGDGFLRWVLTHQRTHRCSYVQLRLAEPGDPNSFVDFPDDPRLAAFDPSDRAFTAAARAHPDHPPVWEAVDTDWQQHARALQENGVAIEFLCPDDIAR